VHEVRGLNYLNPSSPSCYYSSIFCAACVNFSVIENSDSDVYLAKTPRAPSSELFYPFAAFASLRKIFRDLVAVLPR
jgi:hypothetical protein